MRPALALVMALGLAACDAPAMGPTLPPGVSNTDVALFKTAVANAGCVIENDAQAAPVEARTGFSEDKLGDIADYLIATGELDITMLGIRLTTGPCANA